MPAIGAKRTANRDCGLAARKSRHPARFKRWFGDSNVVDGDGEPLVVYHGTCADFPTFAEPGDLEGGHATSALGIFFATDPNVAALFAGEGHGARLIPAYLRIRRPWAMSYGEFSRRWITAADRDDWGTIDLANEFRGRLDETGFDGILIRRASRTAMKRGANEWAGDTWVAFHPDQVMPACSDPSVSSHLEPLCGTVLGGPLYPRPKRGCH